jgi:hypothetical protein
MSVIRQYNCHWNNCVCLYCAVFRCITKFVSTVTGTVDKCDAECVVLTYHTVEPSGDCLNA